MKSPTKSGPDNDAVATSEGANKLQSQTDSHHGPRRIVFETER